MTTLYIRNLDSLVARRIRADAKLCAMTLPQYFTALFHLSEAVRERAEQDASLAEVLERLELQTMRR